MFNTIKEIVRLRETIADLREQLEGMEEVAYIERQRADYYQEKYEKLIGETDHDHKRSQDRRRIDATEDVGTAGDPLENH